MNFKVWQIIKKDMRRFRLLLALWCTVLVLRISLSALLGDGSYNPGRVEHVLAVLLLLLLNAHLVVRVLAEDSPLKDGAFWRMRPITGRQMLTAKVLFIAGWTWVLPGLITVLGGWAYGFSSGECLAVAAGQLVLHAAIGTGFLLVAIFTQRVWVSVLGVWLAMILVSVVMAKYQAASMMGRRVDTTDGIELSTASLELSRMALAGGLLIAACILAVAWVYRDRRRLAAGVVLAAALVAAKVITVVWPWDYLGGVPALQQAEARPDPRYTVELVGTSTSGRATLNDVRYRQVSSSLKWSGLNDGEVVVVYRVAGALVWTDGTEMPQVQTPPWRSAYDLTGALKALGVATSDSTRMLINSGVTLAQIEEEDIGKLKQAPAEWRGRIWAKIGRVKPEFRVPLKQGARLANGADLTAVSDVRVEGDSVRIRIHERHADLPGWKLAGLQSEPVAAWLPQSYTLINLRRKDALYSSGGGGRSSTDDGFFSFRRSDIEFHQYNSGGKTSAVEWTEWLEDAELVRFRFVEERRVVVDVATPVAYRP